MQEYWGHTLDEEDAAYHSTATDKVFRIASITKQFTAAGILLLAERAQCDPSMEVTFFHR